MTRELTRRGLQRRSQLLDVATRLFADRGYHQTSVSDVVTGCGVGKGVFYWYFESKEALFVAILSDALQDMRRVQQAAIGAEGDPVNRIAQGITASMDYLSENVDIFRLFEFAATDATFANEMRKGIDIAVEDVTRHLKDAVVDGLIPDNDLYFLGHGIVTITMNFFRNFLTPSDDAPPTTEAEVVNAAVDFCLHGIGLERGG